MSNFTVGEKEKKYQHYCKCIKNISEDQKQKLIKYRRNYYLAHKKTCELLNKRMNKNISTLQKAFQSSKPSSVTK